MKINKALLLLMVLLILILSVSAINAQEIDNPNGDLNISDDSINIKNDEIISSSVTNDDEILSYHDSGDFYLKFDQEDIYISPGESVSISGDIYTRSGSKLGMGNFPLDYSINGKGQAGWYCDLDNKGHFSLVKNFNLAESDTPYKLSFNPQDGYEYWEEFVCNAEGELATSWLFIHVSSASPDTLYVDSNYAGSDSDGSRDKPFKDIKSALTAADDTINNIQIANGVYNNEGTLTINKNLNIIGKSQDGVIVNNAIFKYTTDLTGTLINLTINGASSAKTAAIDIAKKAISLNVSNVNINNWIIESSDSVVVSKSTSPVVLNNVNIFNTKATAESGTSATSIINAATTTGGLTIKNSIIDNTQFLGTTNSNGIIKCVGSTVNMDNVVIANTTGRTTGLIHAGTNTAIVNIKNSKILNNNIQGSSATSTAANGVMFYAAGGSSAKANVTVENSIIKNNVVKNHLVYTSYATVTLNYNIISNHTQGRMVYKSKTSDEFNGDYNWWGSNTNPDATNINNVVVMTTSASPAAVESGKTSTITADFTKYNESGTLSPLSKNIPDAIVVNFNNQVDKEIKNGRATYSVKITDDNNVIPVRADKEEQNVTVEVLLPVYVDSMYKFVNGVVSGSADIIAVNPWTTSGSLQYTIPDDVKEIKSAIVIVNSYSGSGNSDTYALHSDVTLTTDSTKTLGSENLTYSGNQANDPTVYVINAHTTKQYSDYQYTYDILSDISSLTPGSTVTVNVANSAYGNKGFDGRIKIIGLFIAYDDGDADNITYWLNIGQVWSQQTSSISVDTKSYNGPTDDIGFKSIALSSYLADNIKFNGITAVQPSYKDTGSYYIYLTWDNISSYFNKGNDIVYSYSANGQGYGSYKTNLILVTAAERVKCEEIYVSPNGNNSNSGLDWDNAVMDIETALSLIDDGGTIYVDEGTTYTASGTSGISIAKNVDIVGKNNNVVIDANNAGIIFNIGAYNVNLANLTLINGNANSFASKRGAAIFADGTTLNINNCNFINNTAGPSSYGGAINLISTSTTINNSTFDGNTAYYAGGAINAENTNILLDISNSVFANNRVLNTGSAYGGAVCSYGTANIDKSTFYNNTCPNGASINQYDGALTVTNSILLDGVNGVTIKDASLASCSVENSWWGNNDTNKVDNPKTLGYTNDDVESYLVLNTTVSTNDLLVGNSASIILDLTKNQNDVVVGNIPDLPVHITAQKGNVAKNDDIIKNGKLTFTYTATEFGEGKVIVESYNGVISETTFNNKYNVAIERLTTPWGDGIYAGLVNNLTVVLNNKGSEALENITVELYSNESDVAIATISLDSLSAGSNSIKITDSTIREITESTVWPAAQNNKVRFTVHVKYNDEELSSKSFDKILAYDGYLNKTYAYGNPTNEIASNYTISGDIIISSQPLSSYKDQYSRQRTETWDISVPDGSTLVKAFLYFNYNWDTSFFPDGWTLTFNGNSIIDKYIFWDTDKGNLGGYGAYQYGLLVFDVSSYFVNGENTFNITKTGNCALYPSTLVVLYNTTDSDTLKDVYFVDMCDVLYAYYNMEYINKTNVYVPYNDINTTRLEDATWYVFAGSASGNGDGDLSFNGKKFNSIWSSYSSDNTCFAYAANVTDVISENNDAWYLTDLNRMTTVVVYEQILVVTRADKLPTAETTVKSEYTSVPTVYAGVNNTITVTVKNTGVSARDVVVTLKIGDEVIGTETLANYVAGETYTLTFVDTTIRPVTENTVNGNNNEYMNYTVVVENSEGVLINETNSSFVILYNGNLGKDYEYPNANPLLREYNITGDVIVANGSQYAGSSDNVNDVITVAFEGDVAEALLYVSYNWNNPSLGDFTSWNITFNNKVIAPIASYNDQGNMGNYGKYAYGLIVYNVTGLVVNGENALSINRTPKNVAIYPASLLVLTNDEDSFVEKTVYILEEVDLLSKTYNKNLPAGFNTAFDVIDGNATLYVFAASAQKGEGNLIVNDETYTDVWKGTANSVEVFTSDVDAGNIKVYFESTGGTILALHQIVVVSNERLPEIDVSALKTPWNDGIYAAVDNNLTVTINNKQSRILENVIIELYSNESDELIATYTIDSLAPGTSSIVINDPTIRELTESTVWPAAINNKIAYNVVVKYGNVEIFNKSFDKIVAYDGYLNKTYAYNGAPNKINRNYTITGDIIVASQPTDVYADQYSRQRNETWDISVPDDSTLVKAFLYFNYNWDTSYFPDGWTLTFNGNTITDKYIFWDTDKGNLGYWGNYIYGTLVFDVTEYFNNGENIFNITKTGNCALYPSTLVVLYNTTGSKTIKDVYFTDICDVLYGYYNTEYTNLTNVYVPYNGINTTNLADASWYVFAGSADGSNDGNISFNGKVFDNLWSEGSSNSCYAYIANVTDVIGENNNAWYLTNPKLMTTVVVYEQILVVTRNLELPTAETTVKSEYTSVPTVYAGVNNTITVTVKNTGVSARDVVVTLKIGDEVIGTETLANYVAGETYTLTFVDTTIRPVTENTVNGNNNEYMNYTVVVENSEGVLINETNSSFVILYNGNLGKDYEYPNANPLLREYNITGDVIVANGSQYAGSSDNVNDVITVAFEGDVAEALLYVSYNWNNPSLGDFTSWNITFNNKVIAPIASYNDQGNMGNYGKYAYGLIVYNVTGLVVNGENALSINRTPKNVAIYPASLLVLTNDEDSFVEKTVYILEEVDLLSKTYNKNLPAGFNTAFDVIDGNATLYVFAASAQKGEGNLIVNDETYTDVWKGTDKSVEVFTTDVDAGNIKVYFESTGATILALHQIVVVANPITPKENLTLEASADSITVGEDAVIVVTGFEDATGIVTAVVNGKSYTAPINGGKAVITVPGLTENATAVITYPGDDKYNNASTTVDIVVNPKAKENATISIDAPSEVTEGDNVTVTVTLPEDATGTVTIGNEVVPVRKGVASAVLTNLPVGNNTVPVNYSGDDKYNSIETSVTVIVNPQPVPKKDLNVSVSADPITVGEDAVIVVSDLADATGIVTAVVNGKSYTAPINGGKAVITVPGLTENVTAVVSYPGDDKYNPFETSVTVIVNPKAKENATIDIDVPPVTEGQNATVTVTLPKDATGTVTATVKGKTYTAPVKDGKATISIPELAAGNYTVPVNYSGDDKYNSITEEVNITVDEDKSDIIKAPDVTKYFNGPERFVVTVTDYQGKPLNNKSVTISINGRSYTRTTDDKGIASIALGLNSGVYNAKVTVDNKTINSVVTILSTAKGNDITKVFRNGTQFYATFLDSQGNYLKEGETVRFNINGVMYDRKVSGDKGLAKLNINLPEGKYIITAMNLKTGENTVNNITVLPTIIENKDITKYYRNATQYTVKLLGADGNPVGAGESVTFNINGVFYTRQTDANGIAKININLPPGNYVITAEYKGCRVSNNIKVLPILNAVDIKMKYRDGTQFKATLVDGQGKPYAGQYITFNINGVFYNRETDSTGTAKLNINLMPGEYIITSSYNGSNIANTIKISA